MNKIYISILISVLYLSSVKISNAQNTNFSYSVFPAGAPLCEGVTLIFTDNSIGATSWDWNFGAGAIPQISVSQGPVIVVFDTCGTFAVTLSINGGGGVLTYTDTIIINCNPLACFTVNPDSACLGVPISFNSSCSIPGSGTLSYLWDFGNGDSSLSANPTYTYSNPNSYSVALVLTNRVKDAVPLYKTLCMLWFAIQ